MHISSIRTVLPTHMLTQGESLAWLVDAHVEAERFRLGTDFPEEGGLRDYLLRHAIGPDAIAFRGSDCPDVRTRDWQNHRIYRLTPESPRGADIQARTRFFGERALEIMGKLYAGATPPDHLIHVTCTGYQSPSPAQRWVAAQGWPTEVTHSYHMGCYASLPAVRLAVALAREDGRRVDVAHTEMCSLHLDPLNHSAEQAVLGSLFADGHARYQVSEEPSRGPGFRVRALAEKILPDSADDMTWEPGPWGMRMSLAKEIPDKIGFAAPGFLSELAGRAHLPMTGMMSPRTLWAIHPGGPKIIDAVQTGLNLTPSQIQASRDVLHDRGNMSSATLPHVWERILAAAPDPGTLVVSLAFGPGLTLFGAVFEVT